MIELRPYAPEAAAMVFRGLDGWDLVECSVLRGRDTHHLELFADWHAAQGAMILSWVLHARAGQRWVPVAVVGALPGGAAGVARVGLLARQHDAWRVALGRLAVMVRRALPDLAATHGVRRVEAMSLAAHPTGGGLLTSLGLAREARLTGFGPEGRDAFDLYAWTRQTAKGDGDV